MIVTVWRTTRVVCLGLLMVACPIVPASAQDVLNRVPNPSFSGQAGESLGDVTGTVPDYWRGFAVSGGAVTLEAVPLAANELYSGSPATNAVRLTVGAFGGDQGFDHTQVVFSLQAGHEYVTEVWLRSANAGGAAQGVNVGVPVFDGNGFTGRQPGTFDVQADGTWRNYSGPGFTENGGTAAHIAFRLANDGGENSVLIALPRVDGPVDAIPMTDYPAIYTPGRIFSPTDRFVATTVFHWYGLFYGQVSGPWAPPGGRAQWDGELPFWREQVKDMMDANIDVLYVHLFNGFEFQREQLFRAIGLLRAEGYDTPYLVPFLDPLIIWDQGAVNVSNEAGRDEYVNWYRRWFDQYLRNDTGAAADTRLLRIDGEVVLNTWHNNPTHVTGLATMSREDVLSRLQDWLGDDTDIFEGGIYQIGSTNGVAPPWSDEVAHQFANNEYYSTNLFDGNNVATVKGGYWDQNVRDPGSFLPRDGGDPYREAWTRLNAEKDGTNPIYHAYIESWNEYDEGTGIYEADTGDPYVAPGNDSGNTDTWSDTDNPREYIDTTSAGAAGFTGRPEHDAQFLWSHFPAQLSPGGTGAARLLVRNAGNLEWSDAVNVELAELAGDHAWGPARQGIDPQANEIDRYGGVFRGRPVLYEFDVTAPTTAGVYPIRYRMRRGAGGPGPFGGFLEAQVAVSDALIEEGHSGAFYNPQRSGEGVFVEILNDQQALVYTFSYRPDGSGPAWFLGVGRIEGGAILLDEQQRPTGARFGNDFDAEDVDRTPAGSMSMAFLDCESRSAMQGSTVYSGVPELGYSPFNTRAARLSQIVGCGSAAHENAGLSGSFYDPNRSGEGLIVQWLNNGTVLAIMFTYDLDGNQFWFLGTGTPDGNTVVIDAVYPATPTGWGEGFDPDEIDLQPFGTLTLEWTDCNSLRFSYASVLPGFGSDTLDYVRLTQLSGTQCPATD